MLVRVLLSWTLVSAGTVYPLHAQEPGQPATRAEALARERETKAGALSPPEQGPLEGTLIWLENDRLLERIFNPAQGFYPKLGNITPGSGLAYGLGFRKPELFGGHADFNTFAAGSLDKYWMLDATLTLPHIANGRVFADVKIQRYNFPEEDFFGLGPDSLRAAETSYREKGTVVGGGAGLRPVEWFSLSSRIEYRTPRLSDSIEARLGDLAVDFPDLSGLIEQPDFVRYEVSADLNYRQPQGNPRRGGRYFVSFQRYDDQDFNRYTFSRLEADIQQYVPFLNDRRVIALRGFTSLSRADEGQRVPFYLQRTLGGPDDLRGFRRFRFRDENILLLQAEYRWEIFTAMDGAIFYDAGMVAPTRRTLSLSELESDYGIGFRFGTINGIFLRIEGAFGSSGGKHLVIRYAHVF